MTLKTEDERKFLVDRKTFMAWLDARAVSDLDTNESLYAEEIYDVRQGYLSLTAPIARIRIAEPRFDDSSQDKAFLTVKGSGLKKKKEAEAELAWPDHGEDILSMCKYTVTKVRWIIAYQKATWEVDIFEKKLKGLCMAELENQRMPGKKWLPPWLGKEVTFDKRYSNVMLAQHGIPRDYQL